MTDREKLVELINHVCEHHIENLLQPGGAEALASHLIANGVTVREWISVENRLPEDGLVVLLGHASDKTIIAGYPYYESTRWYDHDDNPVGWPTHWMPLPEPPKESEK